MSMVEIDEGTGAARTATGPKVAIAESRATSDNANGQLPPDDKPPSDAPSIDGADLLDRILKFIKRFVVLPSDNAGIALVLWAGHTFFMDVWETTPRLAFLSAQPGSGKTLAMRLVALLCPRALEVANSTTAALIRALDDPAGKPTYFIDEIDTKYGPKAKGDEELRSLINSGHEVDGHILRNEQENNEWRPVKKNAFAAIAMAGIGNILPDTILTRSVVVKMRKRLPGEKVESYKRRDHKHIGIALGDELAAWADQVRDAAARSSPLLPDGIADRDADVWEPLISVADLVGGRWPALARQAAMEAVQSAKVNSKPSLDIQLLDNIRACIGNKIGIPTVDLLKMLLADEEAPWGDLGYHRKLNARILAEMLDEYGIKSKPYRFNGQDGTMLRGYMRDDFREAWARYLPDSSDAVTDVTAVTEQEGPENEGSFGQSDEKSPSRCDGSDGSDAEPES